MNIQVIETVHEDRIEWGISFDGYNPNAQDYFEVTNKQTAFGLQKKLLFINGLNDNSL
jgi:hypothetical protein